LAVYEKISTLGVGGFGSVHLYEHKVTKKLVAIKFIDLYRIISPEDVKRVYTEIGVLRKLKHPSIVELIDTFDCDNKVCFVMEYCSGGELKEYLLKNHPLPEEKIYDLACQISEAIRFCHNSAVIHRDLKLENILFSDKNYKSLKIVDFGISSIYSLGVSGERSDAGSLLYIAPEVLSGSDNRANIALDVWSMGCIFYALVTGVLPFAAATREEVTKKILKCEYAELGSSVPRPWHKLIKAMLRKVPSKRWNLVRILEHLMKYRHSLSGFASSDSEGIVLVEERKEILQVKNDTPRCRVLAAKKPMMFPRIE
jgi:serine/threonine protein kinase